MCVCFWDPCALKIFVERCFWELKMLFGSLVELHTWLHSCLCFSPLKNTVLKSWLDTSLIASYLSSFLSFFLSQSCQHLDTFWIDWESLWPLDSFSTPGGSIEPHLLLLMFQFLDSFSTHDLSTLLFSTFAWQMSRHLICRDLLRALFKLLVQSACHFLDISLDWLLFSLPNTLFSPWNLFYKVSSSFTKLFFMW